MFFSCLGPGSLGAEAEMKIHEWVVYYRSNSRSWRKQEGGQDREEEKAIQGYDFRWSPSLTLNPWGAIEHK